MTKRLAGWWLCYYSLDAEGNVWDYSASTRYTLSRRRRLDAAIRRLEAAG